MRETYMCIKTHIRTKNYSNSSPNTEFVFECGAKYEMENFHIVITQVASIVFFRISPLFLENHFVKLTEWREKQMKNILDEYSN
jgi:hypothetical protein